MSDTLDPSHPLAQPFGAIGDLIAYHARQEPGRPALIDGTDPTRRLDYAGLDQAMDRIAAALQADGIGTGECIAICAASSVAYAAIFLGALRAGVAVAPLAPNLTPDTLARMLADAGAKAFFLDAATEAALAPSDPSAGKTGTAGDGSPRRIRIDSGWPHSDDTPFAAWLSAAPPKPAPVTITPASPFNIIYSSGTTGVPKGIVQPHGMRWAHMQRGVPYGYGPNSITVLSTPLYSNTTLVCFFPTFGFGGTVALMPRFDAAGYLSLCESLRATHTMLVPVQYQRLLAHADFDRHDLSAFVTKFCTSAPFSAALKADVLRRWPGGLVEFYGMTEGGGTCILEAHRHPDKLHTVGRPAANSDIRLIDDEGREVPAGGTGEVVGASPGMMTGYHGRPELTRAAEWFDATGKRFIRTGDIGRFDADGFLVLLDRKKDVIISGGFNIYPSDLEAVLVQHPAVREAAVVGVPSETWGESPVAFVVLASDVEGSADATAATGTAASAGNTSRDNATIAANVLAWTNARLGKTQRLVAVHCVPELPRSPIGKVLKRDLRDAIASRQPA